ncbi:MAG: 3-deoxy-manno-octulosonate cytidylyltransferase [Ignavibacteriales bacterium]|nr:3-deoxy-manno-octulosonate cytidylyltransferase [Ignavibacteriales bacterium]
MSNEKIIGIIPSRYGSTRLAAKPLIDLCGKPMIQRVYEGASTSRFLNKIVVATDDERIVVAVRKFGGEAIMTPTSIESGTERVAYVAKLFPNAEIVANIQGDEPLIRGEMIDETIQPLLNESSFRVATPVRQVETIEELYSPGIPKVVVTEDFFAMYFSRFPIPFIQKELPTRETQKHFTFYKHIGLYVFRADALQAFTALPRTELEKTESLEQLRMLFYGWKIKTVLTQHNTFSVDTFADAEFVREKLRAKKLE